VLKPGGTIAFSTWPPELFTGRWFALMGRYAPPPPAGVSPPPQWGDPNIVRERLGAAVRDLAFNRNTLFFNTLSPQHYRVQMAENFGPAKKLFEQLDANDPAKANALRREIDEHVLRVLATQQPVAGDLRTLVAGLRMDRDLERMGDLARHVAEIAADDFPRDAVPIALHGIVHSMNRVALHLAEQVKEAIAFRHKESAAELDREDDEMDTLQIALYKELLASAPPMQTALDLALLGRYYERYADHAVSIADSVGFEAGASL